SKQGTVRALFDVMPGGMLSLSADGIKPRSGVVWATLPLADRPNPFPGGLYAYNAETLQFLWGTRYGTIAHWVPPTIAGGTVFRGEGDPFQFLSWRLAAYELGNGGSDRQTVPMQPQNPACTQACHATGIKQMAMSDHFTTGGGMRMQPGLTLAAVAPPQGFTPSRIFQATGMRTYRAGPGPDDRQSLVWVLADAYADLTDIAPPPPPASPNAPAPAQTTTERSRPASIKLTGTT